MSALRQEQPDIQIVSHDIYNARKHQKQVALGGSTPAQALVKALEHSSYYHQLKTDEYGCLTHVFFAHPKSLLQLKSYPDVLLLDCTYKTNRFKMPLLVIVGSTNLNTTFFVAFALLARELQADYQWALEALKSVLDQDGYTYPSVVVTDRELALISSLRLVLPSCKRILCEWHVQQNVLCKVVTAFKEKEENARNEFMTIWASVLAAETRVEFEQRWDTLFDTYAADYEDLVWYLKDTWLVFKWNLVRFWVDQNLHFGNRATSRVEGAHSTLKRYLQVSTGNLTGVLDRIQLMLENKLAEHEAGLEMAQQRVPHDVNIPLFAELIGKVTPYALRKILVQYRRLSTLPLPRCSTTFTSSMGMPCAHTIQDRRQRKEDIHLSDVHLHWHFVRPDPTAPVAVELGPLLVHEPAVAKPKGRPPGSKNKLKPASSTTRDPSFFELPTRTLRRQARRGHSGEQS